MAKNGGAAGMAACLGAIVGAGFASGREVVAFFTRYGVHARWLITLSAMTLALLCALWHGRCATGAARIAGGTCMKACLRGCA